MRAAVRISLDGAWDFCELLTFHQRGYTMRLFIAAIIAVLISGCAGGALTGPQTASMGGSSGKVWTADALNPTGGAD
jgi:hypothetical protein